MDRYLLDWHEHLHLLGNLILGRNSQHDSEHSVVDICDIDDDDDDDDDDSEPDSDLEEVDGQLVPVNQENVEANGRRPDQVTVNDIAAGQKEYELRIA